MKKITVKTLLILVSLMLWQCANRERNHEQKKVLVVYAHPDDETAIGGVIAQLSKHHKVVLMIATDGRNGVRHHAQIPKGDSLALVRKQELECSCKKLGIDSLITLGFHDGFGLLSDGGIQEFFSQMRQIRLVVKEKIEKINPDIIITFGPDGDSGHSDHRMIGDFVTEAILSEGWAKRFPLYYAAWTSEQAKMYGGLGYVHEKYLNMKVQFSEEEEQQYFDALKCHWSQYTQEELTKMIDEDRQNKTNTMYFRRFVVSEQKEYFP